MLIRSSKKAKTEGDDLEDKVREALSSIRRQKYKAEAKINRLKQWTNDAISTTYGSLFGDKYFRTELYENYTEIKEKFADKLEPTQVEKADQVVKGYLKHMLTEKSKIETLETLQKEHEQLKDKLKAAKTHQRNTEKLDKHVSRINQNRDDLSAEKTIAKADYTYDDLKKEVDLKQEYVRQLEDLGLKYGENIEGPQVIDYEKQLKELKSKM